MVALGVGHRFGVLRDRETLTALGLNVEPRPAPWSVLRLFVAGPTLSKADALCVITRCRWIATPEHWSNRSEARIRPAQAHTAAGK